MPSRTTPSTRAGGRGGEAMVPMHPARHAARPRILPLPATPPAAAPAPAGLPPTAPLRSLWTRVGRLRMHARVALDAAPSPERRAVVLVHGLVISSRYMVPAAQRLAPYFRVLAPDLPGFGRSSKPRQVLDVRGLADALLEWINAVGLDRVVLLGNSLGCQVIVDFAARYPARVQRAVLAGPTFDPDARTAPAQLRRWLRDWRQEPTSLALAHLRDYASAGFHRAWTTFGLALHDPIERKLPAVKIPTLVVRGEHDPIVSQRWAEEVARLLPRSRLAVIPGAPHAVNYSAPDAFVAVVRQFLDENL